MGAGGGMGGGGAGGAGGAASWIEKALNMIGAGMVKTWGQPTPAPPGPTATQPAQPLAIPRAEDAGAAAGPNAASGGAADLAKVRAAGVTPVGPSTPVGADEQAIMYPRGTPANQSPSTLDNIQQIIASRKSAGGSGMLQGLLKALGIGQ